MPFHAFGNHAIHLLKNHAFAQGQEVIGDGFHCHTKNCLRQSSHVACIGPEPSSPTKGPVLAIIDDEDLADVLSINDSMAKSTGYTEVASFNWLNGKEPTISVPGW